MIEKSGMDEDLRWRQRLDSYRRARRQLQAAVDLGRQRTLSELEQQGLIQAFEFTHELAWNLTKDYLRSLGSNTLIASRDSTRVAFAAGLIDDGDHWMDMIVSRNLSPYTGTFAPIEALHGRPLAEPINPKLFPAARP